jgi:hypothetical protein
MKVSYAIVFVSDMKRSVAFSTIFALHSGWIRR